MAATEKNEQALATARDLLHVPWCEEYERMISGMLYDSLDPTLSTARFRARKWAHTYNHTFPSASDFTALASTRHSQLSSILGAVGPDVFIEPPFNIDYGCNIRLGERFYANFNLCILDCALVTIGARTMFGPNVSILAATHEVEPQSRRDNVEYAKEVRIGEDCWVGGHVVFLPGVEVGDGCTIAAGSVVSRSIPAWSVAMGAPARVVKRVTPLEPVEGRKRVLEEEGEDGLRYGKGGGWLVGLH